MQGIITLLGKSLSKEPFQHESLLVDRKEKKLSSAEKRLAQRGYVFTTIFYIFSGLADLHFSPVVDVTYNP